MITNLYNCFNGNYSYVYIIFSIEEKVCYIGQTNGKLGTIGRLRNHLEPKGTFSKRLFEKKGIEVSSITDLGLFSYRLPNLNIFNSSDTTYRECVEKLVQFKILLERSSFQKKLNVISKTRIKSELINDKRAHDIATDIVLKFKSQFN